MRATRRFLFAAIAFAFVLTLVTPHAMAGDDIKFKKLNVTIGQWKQTVKEAPVKRVFARVQRISGGSKTFINARFGRESTTFENGRRVYLPTGEQVDVVWNVNQWPGGQPLIINAYGGQVLLLAVVVDY